jgi:hypothetical protein
MSLNGFHVSMTVYQPGQVVRVDPGQVTHFHATLEKANNTAGEERLERHRPADAPCRKNCIYVFEDLESCSLYAVSQHKAADVHFYHVKMDRAVRVPMILVDAIRRQQNPSEPQAEYMAREYWHPTQLWEFWELLTDAIEIVDEVRPFAPDSFEVIGAQGSYMDDNDRANQFCRTVMAGKDVGK